jgi:DNA-binding Xre family transcriptional regulator
MVPVAVRCRISDLASDKGWSLGELSRRTGISKSTLSSYDTKRTRNMPLPVALALSEALEVQPVDLYVWEWR